MSGAIVPGARLVERNLAAELGVSRVPVREALRDLVAEGYAVDRATRGIAVRDYPAAEIDELFEIREALEACCCAGRWPACPRAARRSCGNAWTTPGAPWTPAIRSPPSPPTRGFMRCWRRWPPVPCCGGCCSASVIGCAGCCGSTAIRRRSMPSTSPCWTRSPAATGPRPSVSFTSICAPAGPPLPSTRRSPGGGAAAVTRRRTSGVASRWWCLLTVLAGVPAERRQPHHRPARADSSPLRRPRLPSRPTTTAPAPLASAAPPRRTTVPAAQPARQPRRRPPCRPATRHWINS